MLANLTFGLFAAIKFIIESFSHDIYFVSSNGSTKKITRTILFINPAIYVRRKSYEILSYSKSQPSSFVIKFMQGLINILFRAMNIIGSHVAKKA